MNFSPMILGAVGGIVATSLCWSIAGSGNSTSDHPEPPSKKTSSPSSLSAASDWSAQFPPGTRPSEVNPFSKDEPTPPQTSEPLRKAKPPVTKTPTRLQLAQRAILVEEHANVELADLAQRLDLTEDQQDRIFPILANSAPAFHPILRPEGGILYGDGTKIAPGAPIAEVESEVFPELDAVQQAALAEEAIDREAWWDDIVNQLETDLDETAPALVATNDHQDAPSETLSDAEREAAAATNEATDFSNLFGN